MRNFVINGAIVDNDSQKESFEDLTPTQIISFLNKIDEGEDVEIQINSLGGSVFAGLQIYNALRNASKNGHKIITHCTSIAASIASIIFCAGDEMIMDSNSFLCIHLPWSSGICGNAIDIRKEADTLDKICDQMIEIYSKHMSITKDEIRTYLEKETWISTSDLSYYGLNDIKINDVESDTYKIAASIAKKFNHIPKNLVMENIEVENKVKEETVEETVEEVKEDTVETVEEVTEEKTEETEEKSDEVTEETTETTDETTEEETVDIEELKEEIKKLTEENEELKKELDKCKSETVEDRVSGMQSKMQSKINALIKEHNDNISKYENEIKAYSEKLDAFEKESISLKEKLEAKDKELQRTVSALSDRESALHSLNSSVLRPSDLLPSFAEGLRKCKTLEERVEFIKNGKYTIN